MLDVHPEPDHAHIQVRIGQERHDVGNLDDTAYIGDILAGHMVIASLIQEGLFGRDRELTFDQVLHATDLETWLAYREEQSTRSTLDSRIVNRIRALLPEDGGEILVVTRGRASRLVRL